MIVFGSTATSLSWTPPAPARRTRTEPGYLSRFGEKEKIAN